MSDKTMVNYIYYKKKDWLDNKDALRSGIGSLDIVGEYNKNADKLEASMSIPAGISTENFVKNVQSVLEIRKNKKDAVVIEEELQKMLVELTKFVQTNLAKTSLGSGLTVGRIGGGATLSSSIQLNEVMDGLKKIKNTFVNFDESFQSLGLSQVSIIEAEGMEKTAVAYKQLDSFLKKYGGVEQAEVAWDKFLQELRQVCGSLVGDFKGGLLEFGDYMHSTALATVQHTIEDAVISLSGVSMGGTGTTNVSADMAKQLGQSSFVNKSDNFVTVRYTQNSMTIEVDLGISDKSYSKGKAHGKTLASGIGWTPTMTLGGTNLSESAFEYYYANMIVHEASALQKADALNNYLGAKASAFIISGVEGGDKAQAYFIRYANKLVYVPDMLRKMASKNKGLTVKPVSTSIKNEFIQTPETEVVDAYARSRNTMNKIRQSVKFNGILL